MPIQVYNFSIKVNHSGGNLRCKDKQSAQNMYDNVSDQLGAQQEFITIKDGEDISTIRAKDIMSFGINVYLEQTQEEIKEQAIARINAGNNGYDYPTGQGSALSGTNCGNLLKGY